MNYSTMKDLQEQIQNEKQKFCMWLVNSNADIDDELLNMSDAFFVEMKNTEYIYIYSKQGQSVALSSRKLAIGRKF